jgi:molybdopterin molybdotransferase
MIRFEEAYEMVMENAQPLRSEHVPMMDSLGRVLAENVYSDLDMPPFDKSAVDGYAIRMDDLALTLKVVEVIPAGKLPEKILKAGQCAKIMTGAMIPEGADGVIMIEDTMTLGNGNIRFTGKETRRNICFKGEDIKEGELVLSAGISIQPQHIAVLASVGKVNPLVFARAEVGVLSTGNELVEPVHVPAPSNIRNSNAYQLMAQSQKAGANPHYEGIALDTETSLTVFLRNALDQYDIVLLTGGVSVGDFDHVPEVMDKIGAKILFKSIAIQPGRPTIFGRKGNQFIFGLPGNPVSAYVVFEMLVKPFLRKMMGDSSQPNDLLLPLGMDYSRTNSTRKSFLPVKIEHGEVFPLEYHGSAHINAYTMANGIIMMEIGENSLEKGKIVNVRQI